MEGRSTIISHECRTSSRRLRNTSGRIEISKGRGCRQAIKGPMKAVYRGAEPRRRRRVQQEGTIIRRGRRPKPREKQKKRWWPSVGTILAQRARERERERDVHVKGSLMRLNVWDDQIRENVLQVVLKTCDPAAECMLRDAQSRARRRKPWEEEGRRKEAQKDRSLDSLLITFCSPCPPAVSICRASSATIGSSVLMTAI